MALGVMCGFVGVVQFTVQHSVAAYRELWPIRQIDPVINTHPTLQKGIINRDSGQLTAKFVSKPGVPLSPLQLACLFGGCNWVLFWPSAPHVFLIATIDNPAGKKREELLSVYNQDVFPVSFALCGLFSS